jgi:hypothetical protein
MEIIMVWRKGKLDEIIGGTIIKVDYKVNYHCDGDCFIDIILKDGSSGQIVIDDRGVGLEVEVV